LERWFRFAAWRAAKEVEMLKCVSAITLATHDMARAVAFYGALGFELKYGGPQASFTSFRAGSGYLNLTAAPAELVWFGLGGAARFSTSMMPMCSMHAL
jgi:catechol 2,3-dioxygenase-like lactoylglutathione lyase family enzyme